MLCYPRIRIGQIGENPTVAFAVRELRDHLHRMDGSLCVDVLQCKRRDVAMADVLWVGRDAELAGTLPEVADAALDDAIRIDVEDGAGIITGTNDRSVLLAAYRFLRELGFRWVRPGRGGERVPRGPFVPPTMRVCEAASYRHRGVCIEGSNSYENVLDMIDYLPKVGMNTYFMQFMVPYEFFRRWYEHDNNPHFAKETITRAHVAAMTEKLEAEIGLRRLMYHKTGHGWTCEPFGIEGDGWRQSHAEITDEQRRMMAEVDGVRGLWGGIALNTQLCYSDPEVRRRMTDAIAEYCAANPRVDVLHFWLADGKNNHCECAACRAKRPSDWYVTLLNELDEKLTARGIPTRIVFLIYVDLLWEPEEVWLAHPERFILMFAPITRRYGECYGDCAAYSGELAPYERNRLTMPRSLQENLARLRRWQRDFDGDAFVYDYHLMWAHLEDPGYEACARNLHGDMRDLAKIGLNGMVSCQVQRCFFPTALPITAMAAALWDAGCDYDAVADDWYAAAFGADGKAVRARLREVSELFTLYGKGFAGLAERREACCADRERLGQALSELEALAARNAGGADACRDEWRALGLYADYVARLDGMLARYADGDAAAGERAAEELLEWLNERELELQPVMDVENVHFVVNTRLKAR